MSERLIKVLLIESDEADVKRIGQYFEEFKEERYEVVVKTNYDDAVFYLSHDKNIDIILLDIRIVTPLGSFKGIQKASLTPAPIIILTSLYDTKLAIKSVQGGAQDYLVKEQTAGRSLRRTLLIAIEREKIITHWEEEKLSRQLELEKLAFTDELTGLFNRRHLRDQLRQEMFRADRYESNLSILLLDLDQFKQVNDKFGHETGDQVLVVTGAVLKHSIRVTDIFGRYGGEEFCLILPETNLSGALTLAEHLRIKLADTWHYAPDGSKFKVTASIGVATYERTLIDTVSFIKRADQAMYEAKKSGRNAVCVHNG